MSKTKYRDGREIAAPRSGPTPAQINRRNRLFWLDPSNSAWRNAWTALTEEHKEAESAKRKTAGEASAAARRKTAAARAERVKDARRAREKLETIAAAEKVNISTVTRDLRKRRPK